MWVRGELRGRFASVALLGHIRLSFWISALGALVVYLFFVVLAAIPLAEVRELSAVGAAIAALMVLRSARVNRELADPGGDPRVRRALNRQRERRGF
jgi:hypothetical protein